MLVRPPLEHPDDAAGVALKQPLSALRPWTAPAPAPGWWHWLVGGRSRRPGHAASGRLARAGAVAVVAPVNVRDAVVGDLAGEAA